MLSEGITARLEGSVRIKWKTGYSPLGISSSCFIGTFFCSVFSFCLEDVFDLTRTDFSFLLEFLLLLLLFLFLLLLLI